MGRKGKGVALGFDQLVESGASTGSTQTHENVCGLADEEEQLLFPGLLDDITVNYVVPKLPWRSFHSLALVSRRWQQAIRSRQLYYARVRSNSTETFLVTLVLSPGSSSNHIITLYSIKDKCCYQLLNFPDPHMPIQASGRCVILDGKIYVLGGHKYVTDTDTCCSEVYAFDLVEQRGWQKCANMHEPRCYFGCAVKDGKIYVYDGEHCDSRVWGSELYDPEKNTWSRIAPMPFWRYGHQEATLGEELPVYRGQICSPRLAIEQYYDEEDINVPLLGFAVPLEDEWRVVQPAPEQLIESVFTARGKLYSLTNRDIAVYDDSENTWSHRHSNSFAALGLGDSLHVIILNTLAFKNELLLAVLWKSGDIEVPEYCLLQSTGFGTDIEEIVWQKVNFPLLVYDDGASDEDGASWSPLIGLIEL